MQGEIIAGAIAASATVETDTITIDPDGCSNCRPAKATARPTTAVRHRLPDQSRARRAGAAPPGVADQDARAHLRSRRRADPRQPQSLRPRRRAALRPAAAERRAARPARARLHRACAAGSARGDLPLYHELGPENGKGYPEVAQALQRAEASMVRINERGEVIVSVAVPVQRFRAVRGALMLSTQGADIDDMVEPSGSPSSRCSWSRPA